MGEPQNYLGTLKLIEVIREDLLQRGVEICRILVDGCWYCRADVEGLLALAGWTRADFYQAFQDFHA